MWSQLYSVLWAMWKVAIKTRKPTNTDYSQDKILGNQGIHSELSQEI